VFNISVEKMGSGLFDIHPMSIKRDWMDATSEKHAYRCFPVTQANVIGWYLSCKEDIVFTWDGINDQTADHIKIVSPERAYSGRGQSTISFDTSLVFKTDEDVSLLTINPVNYFNNDFETMSSLISTSFYDKPLPLALKAKKAKDETVIKSGTPVATIIPISLTNLNNTIIDIVDYVDKDSSRQNAHRSYGDAAQVVNSSGQWTDWYRNAVDENGNSIGSHEVKTLKLGINDMTGKQ
jgi:hypothetical protein